MKSPFIETDFYAMRHGEADHNFRRVLSYPESPLTDTGRKVALMKQPLFQTLFGGHYNYFLAVAKTPRALETAELGTGRPRKSFDMVDSRLNERVNGSLGKVGLERFNMIKKRRPRFEEKIRLINGAQTLQDYGDRVIPAVEEALLNARKENKKAVIVSHQGTMTLMAEALGIEGFSPEKAGIYHFIPNEKTHRWTVLEVGLQHGNIVEMQPKLGKRSHADTARHHALIHRTPRQDDGVSV